MFGGIVALVVVANKWLAREQLKNVRVIGQVVLDTTEVLKQVALGDTVVLRELDLRELEERITSHPFIRSAAAYYGGDGQLVLEIEERSPVAATVMDGLPVYLDVKGMPLPFRFGLAAPDVPVLDGILSDSADVIDSLRAVEAVAVATTLQEYGDAVYRRVAAIRRESSGEYTLVLADGAVSVRAGFPEEIGPRLYKLEAFLRNVLASEGARNAEVIDIRWDGQVVVRWRRNSSQA